MSVFQGKDRAVPKGVSMVERKGGLGRRSPLMTPS